ncbi:hypothetical protein FG05_07789 [Fusarium graminearum]|nr:hypothetical protein FG05_07789 [Fusarium graminearum]
MEYSEWLEHGWMPSISGCLESNDYLSDYCPIDDNLPGLSIYQTQEDWNPFPSPPYPTEEDSPESAWLADNGQGWHEVSAFADTCIDQQHVESTPSGSTGSRPSTQTSARFSKIHLPSAGVSTGDIIGQPHDEHKHEELADLSTGKGRTKRKCLSEGTKDTVRSRGASSRSTVKANRQQRVVEQNRLAASRFRKRKRSTADALGMDLERLKDQHRELSKHRNGLQDELFKLKSQVLEHGSCDCALMRQYIDNEAHRIVLESSLSTWTTIELPPILHLVLDTVTWKSTSCATNGAALRTDNSI